MGGCHRVHLRALEHDQHAQKSGPPALGDSNGRVDHGDARPSRINRSIDAERPVARRPRKRLEKHELDGQENDGLKPERRHTELRVESRKEPADQRDGYREEQEVHVHREHTALLAGGNPLVVTMNRFAVHA
jgi:hypothetical protein